jgi:AcrR family transcriptional regulator
MESIVKNTRRDQTRWRILNKADELFHRFGFYKTTVADIARELEMSPANVYKFFASKQELVQAVAELNMTTMKTAIVESTKAEKYAIGRLKAFVLAIHRVHQNKFCAEHEIYRLILAAHDEQWPCLVDFKKFLHGMLTEILESGRKTEEFSHFEASIEAGVVLDSLAWIINPLLMFELKNTQVLERIDAQIRFFERALT